MIENFGNILLFLILGALFVGMSLMVAMLVFVFLIFIGFAYDLGKGHLQWDIPKPMIPRYVEGRVEQYFQTLSKKINPIVTPITGSEDRMILYLGN